MKKRLSIKLSGRLNILKKGRRKRSTSVCVSNITNRKRRGSLLQKILKGKKGSKSVRFTGKGSQDKNGGDKIFKVCISKCDMHDELSEFLFNCISYIRSRISSEKGIFRCGGNFNDIKTTVIQIDGGEKMSIELLEKKGFKVVCSVIKRYLRELPEGLLSRMFHMFIELDHEAKKIDNLSTANEIEVIKRLVALVPEDHSERIFFAAFFHLLHDIANVKETEYSEEERIDSNGLAVIIAPNLFSDDQSFLIQPGGTVLLNRMINITQFMIDNFEKVFIENRIVSEEELKNPKEVFLRILKEKSK